MKKAMAGLAVLIGTTTSQAGTPVAARPSVVRFDIESSGGSPCVIVTAKFNGHPMPMMVHSNAVFFAQLRHDQAAEFGVEVRRGTHRSYGIDRGGHVSDLGRDDGRAALLSVGASVNRDAPVTIFEVPQKQYGMLGTGWITANRVVVDFSLRQVVVAPTMAHSIMRARHLKRRGYVALPLTYDRLKQVYRVNASINGVTRHMTVATASIFGIDSAFAEAALLRHGADQGHGSGPTGAHVPEYALASPVRVTIGGWTSPPIVEGRIQDTYGYSGISRPVDATEADGGALGGAFLQQTQAVIDFGSRILFVKG